jgi:transcriptional regulator GlxA family with amidase domain
MERPYGSSHTVNSESTRRLEEDSRCDETASGVNDDRLARALRSVLDHPDRAFRMRELASCVGMSRAAFAKRFSAEIGIPAMQFVRTLRLQYAAHLLATTSRPIKAVASLAGYASRSQFSRAFRKQYRVNPTQFRARCACRPTTACGSMTATVDERAPDSVS